MGLSLSAATATICIVVLLAVEIFTSSMIPTVTELRESFTDVKQRMKDQLFTEINITGIVDTANPWWNISFYYRKCITINHTEVGDNLTNFPVLVNLSDTDLKDHVLQSNGNDIVFVNDENTQKLDHEIEFFDSDTGRLIAWVELLTVYNITNTIFYIYYGNATCPNQQNLTGVWANNYVMVQHLNETSGLHYDSTSYNNDGTITEGLTQGTTGLSQLDGCDQFDGGQEYINFDNDSSLAPSTLTLEGWVKDPPSSQTLQGKENLQDNTAPIYNDFWMSPEYSPSPDPAYLKINFSKFWPLFYNSARWILEYNHSGIWTDCSSSLTINYTSLAENIRKFSLDFTAPYTAQYRLRLTFGYNITDYQYIAAQHTYTLTIDSNNALCISFNYSDIASLPQLTCLHGVSENSFWFTILHQTMILRGSKVSLDPQYQVSTGAVTNSTAFNNGRKLVRTTDGALHCVFHAIPPGNTKYNIYYAKSITGGLTWAKTLLINDSSSNQLNPSIAVDSNDNLHVVWQGKTWIRYCKYSGSWSAPSNITTEPYKQYNPAIAVDSNDYLHVVWYGYHVGSTSVLQIRYAKYTTKWSAPSNVTKGTGNQYSPAIAVNSTNTLHVVWHGFPTMVAGNTWIRYSKYTNIWSAPTNITTESYSQSYPSIAIDKNTNLHVVWQGYHSGSKTATMIRYSKYTTKWSAPANITTGATSQSNPTISIDGDNSLHVVWYAPELAVPFNSQIRYSNYTTKWSLPTALTTGAIDKYYPNLIWSYHPSTVDVCWPETGYAFVFMNDTIVTYYASTDLTWQNKRILTMTKATYSLEIDFVGNTLYGYINNTQVKASITTAWHYVGLTYDKKVIRLYKDGQLVDSTSYTNLISYPGTLPNVTAGMYLTGWLDELRISETQRSTAWINTTYRNQYSPATFLYLSDEHNIDNRYLNITVENTGEVTLLTADFDILINGTLLQFTCSHAHLPPENHVYFISLDLLASGEKRIKVVTDNGIAYYYQYPG